MTKLQYVGTLGKENRERAAIATPENAARDSQCPVRVLNDLARVHESPDDAPPIVRLQSS